MAETIKYGIEIDDKGSPKLVNLAKEFNKTGKAGEKAGRDMSNGLKSAADRIPGLSSAMSAFSGGPMAALATGAVVVGGAFVANAFKAMQFADGINDLSLRLGVSTERLSAMSVMAEQSGTSIEAVASAMGKLSAKVGAGDQDLKDLGITARNADEAMFQLADIIKATEDPTLRAAIANKALGKSWQEMMPLLVQGGDELRKMADNAPIVSAETARLADSIGDRWAELMGSVKAVGLSTFETFGPFLDSILEKLNKSQTKFGALMRSGTSSGVNVADIKAQAAGTFLSQGQVEFDAKAAADKAKDLLKESPEEKAARLARESEAQRKMDAAASLRRKNRELDVMTGQKNGVVTSKEGEDYLESGRKEVERMWEDSERRRVAKAETEAAKILEIQTKAAKDAGEAQERAMAAAADATAARWNMAANAMTSAFSTAFSQTMNNGRNLFGALADSFKNMLLQMAAEMAAKAAVFGLLQMITGGGAGAALGGKEGPTSLLGFMFGGGKAYGGDMQGGKSYLVGERGPEWVSMGANARATPAGAVNITINAGGISDPSKLADMVSRAIREKDRKRLSGVR